MIKRTNGAAHALFQSVSQDKTCWLFVILPSDGWTITRNGKQVALGTSERTSVVAGVEKFLSLTRTVVGSDAACDAAVGAQLDRIASALAAPVTAAKSEERVRRHALRRSSSYVTAY